MKKVELFTLGRRQKLQELQELVNKFMEHKTVIDVKFSSSITVDESEFYWTQDILVLYEE